MFGNLLKSGNSDYKKISNWLKSNAPKLAEFSLQPPATKNDVQELENEIGKALPEDFKQLYFWHNGLDDANNLGSLFYGMDFLPIEKIKIEYASRKRTVNPENYPLKKADKGIDATSVLNHDWIMFAFDNSHTALFLDLTPTSEGKYGQIIFIDDEYETGILVANSTAELVSGFYDDLINKRYFLSEDALEDDNHFLETDSKIDIVNWQRSERWQR